MAKSPSGQTRAPAATPSKTSAQSRSPAAAPSAKAPPKQSANLDLDTDDEEDEADEVYALVSVLYHALQGASASRKYITDAETAEDQELVEFFQRCREDDQARAKEAKLLLAARVDEEEDDEGASEGADDDDEEDEEDDEDEK